MNAIKVVEGIGTGNIPESILMSNTPVVMKGMVFDWPLVQSSVGSSQKAFDYLCQFYSGVPVNAAFGEPGTNGRIFYNEDMTGFNYERRQIRLDAVMDIIRQKEAEESPAAFYIDSVPVDMIIPGFRDNNDLNLGDRRSRVSLWVGNKSVVSAHYDIPDNIACVVAGKRRFTLFPPDQLTNLYIGPLDFNPAGPAISLVDLANPDFDKFPKAKHAMETALVAELEAGDAIFIPGMWWHSVEGLEPFNALVNYWWTSLPTYFSSPLDAFNLALMSIKGLDDSERKSWKTLFEHYIFDYDEKNFSHIPKERRGIIDEVDEISARRLRSQLVNRLNR